MNKLNKIEPFNLFAVTGAVVGKFGRLEKLNLDFGKGDTPPLAPFCTGDRCPMGTQPPGVESAAAIENRYPVSNSGFEKPGPLC